MTGRSRVGPKGEQDSREGRIAPKICSREKREQDDRGKNDRESRDRAAGGRSQ